MVRALVPFLILLLFCRAVCAQEEDSVSITNMKPVKLKSSRYLGVQANQLIRQLLNFSNSTSAIDNPYLITYSVNSKITGVGFSTGLGLSMSDISDGDPTNRRQTKINSTSFRFGLEKKSRLGKQWIVSWATDILYENTGNETTNTQSQDPTNPAVKSVSTTNNGTSVWGFGPRFTLNFRVSDKILIGTEANYYYKSGSTTSNASTTSTFLQFDPNTGKSQLTTRSTKTESSSDVTKFQFVLPSVLYLVIKF